MRRNSRWRRRDSTGAWVPLNVALPQTYLADSSAFYCCNQINLPPLQEHRMPLAAFLGLSLSPESIPRLPPTHHSFPSWRHILTSSLPFRISSSPLRNSRFRQRSGMKRWIKDNFLKHSWWPKWIKKHRWTFYSMSLRLTPRGGQESPN